MGRYVSLEDREYVFSVSQASLLLKAPQYEFERRTYAQDLINFDKKWAALFSGKPRTEDNQDGVTHEEFLQYVSLAVTAAPL